MVYTVNPLSDLRWQELVAQHPRASIFHTTAWLRALRQTYGYEPVVYTRAASGQPMKEGIVFCRIRSWLTGRRLVSLPFSDHCDPLLDDGDDGADLFRAVRDEKKKEGFRYIELRPFLAACETWDSFCASDHFALHQLFLDRPLESIFQAFHRDCIRRKVRRAEREELYYESGNNSHLLRQFYSLMLQTRRRQLLPPQPARWFANLAAAMKDDMTIHMALHDGRPVASLITLRFRDVLVYKYGCSDGSLHPLGGVPFLFSKIVEGAWQRGVRLLDLGRSDVDNAGLIDFKDRLGATRTALIYWRHGSGRNLSRSPALRGMKRVLASLPDAAFAAAGNLLYRHAG